MLDIKIKGFKFFPRFWEMV